MQENFDTKFYKQFPLIHFHFSNCNDTTNKDANDLNNMINTDVLFMAKSSYSKVASLYCKGIMFYNIDGSNDNIPQIYSTNFYDYNKYKHTNTLETIILNIYNNKYK